MAVNITVGSTATIAVPDDVLSNFDVLVNDPRVATVANGTVTAVGIGNATVRVRRKSDGVERKILFAVIPIAVETFVPMIGTRELVVAAPSPYVSDIVTTPDGGSGGDGYGMGGYGEGGYGL